MVNSKKSINQMDISLVETTDGTNIQPLSIHGILWLQTHFSKNNWDALANAKVLIPFEDAKMLSEDAMGAGIQINFSSSFLKSRKF